MDIRSSKESIAVLQKIRKSGGTRLDGRGIFEARQVSIHFEKSYGCVLVRWGQTMVRATVTGEIVVPRQEGGNEGEFRLSCRFTGMAGSELIRGQSSESWAKQELECSSLLMKLIKDAKIVDTESLCVVTGEKVWKITCEVDALNNDGNLFDASFLAAVAGIKTFRREEISVLSSGVVVHEQDQRAPVPLSISQIGVLVSFAQFKNLEGHTTKKIFNNEESEEESAELSDDEADVDGLWLIDTSRPEEQTASGYLRVGVDQFGQILGVFTQGGATVSTAQYSFLVEKALEQSKRILSILEVSVQQDNALRLEEQKHLNGNSYALLDKRQVKW